MKTITIGHSYQLKNFEGDGFQVLDFIHKEKHANSGELEMLKNGTTNEEVLSVLIDRMQYLNSVLPCRENSIVITKLQEALMWIQHRKDDRIDRGVLGTDNK